MSTVKKRVVIEGPGVPGSSLPLRQDATEGWVLPNSLCSNGIVNCLETFLCTVSNRVPNSAVQIKFPYITLDLFLPQGRYVKIFYMAESIPPCQEVIL